MSKLGQLGQLTAASTKRVIAGMELESFPLKLDELSMIDFDKDEMLSPKNIDAIYKLVFHVMRRSIPDVEEQEVRDLPLPILNEIVEAIYEVNGFNKKAK